MKFLILGLLTFAATLAHADNYSEGYRMGMLTKFSHKGNFIKSWEGEMQLGNNASYAPGFSPWAFSVADDTPAVVDQLNNALGQFVVLRYEQNLGVVTRDTGYRIVDVLPVQNQKVPQTCVSTSTPQGEFSSGSRVGRVVKISDKGMMNHTWEVILQVGNGGNQFLEMSVYDDPMAHCLIEFLKTGRRATVTYDQTLFYNPMDHSSSYQILKVQPSQAQLAQ